MIVLDNQESLLKVELRIYGWTEWKGYQQQRYQKVGDGVWPLTGCALHNPHPSELKLFLTFLPNSYLIICDYLFTDLFHWIMDPLKGSNPVSCSLNSQCLEFRWTSLVAQMVKNLPAMQETRVWSLDQEDPLEKGMATHSSILAWEIPWTEEPGRLQCMGSQTVGHDWTTNTHTHTQDSGST